VSVWRVVVTAVLLVVVSACATAPPQNRDDLCDIFAEKPDWYDAVKAANKRWDVPMSVMMAFMYQESAFVAKAKPERTWYFGFIPGPRPSDAYGYSQAKDDTWAWYQEQTGNRFADRDDFADAIDFIGWYNRTSQKLVGIATDDPFRLYLAYHEGHGGYQRQSYRDKPWLVEVARKVDRRARSYSAQLGRCRRQLDDRGWFDGWF
jgi:hypothetical protein